MTGTVFVSRRERRLWLVTLGVVATIYATLGLDRTLAEELRSRELLGGAFVLGVSMIAIAVVAHGLRRRAGGAEIGLLVGVAAVYILLFSRMGIPEERTHLIEYSVVALLVLEALRERARHRPLGAAPVWAVGVTSLVGLIDEGIQGFMPNRVFDLRDVLFNILAAVMAVTASVSLSWVRTRGRVPFDMTE